MKDKCPAFYYQIQSNLECVAVWKLSYWSVKYFIHLKNMSQADQNNTKSWDISTLKDVFFNTGNQYAI